MAGSTGMVAVQSFWLWKGVSNKIDDDDPDLGMVISRSMYNPQSRTVT